MLLVDVDGVLQPVGRSVPPRYERFTDDDSDVVLRREHGVWLAQLATVFDLVWATTWGASANRAIGRRLGLAELPHIDLSDLPRGGTRKLGAVAEYVGDRAVAWVDDELYEDAVTWASHREAPTILRRTAPSVGLTEADVQALDSFAADRQSTATQRREAVAADQHLEGTGLGAAKARLRLNTQHGILPPVTRSGDWLELIWWPDDEGTGRLECSTSVGGWGGRSEAWFNREAILDFAVSLRTFPIPPTGSPELSGGYRPPPDWDEVTTLSLKAVAIGGRGQVGVDVLLRAWDTDPPSDEAQSIHVRLPCTYQGLDRFAALIEAMVGPAEPDPTFGHSEGSARIEAELL